MNVREMLRQIERDLSMSEAVAVKPEELVDDRMYDHRCAHCRRAAVVVNGFVRVAHKVRCPRYSLANRLAKAGVAFAEVT